MFCYIYKDDTRTKYEIPENIAVFLSDFRDARITNAPHSRTTTVTNFHN
jgi:hypothetical protein